MTHELWVIPVQMNDFLPDPPLLPGMIENQGCTVQIIFDTCLCLKQGL